MLICIYRQRPGSLPITQAVRLAGSPQTPGSKDSRLKRCSGSHTGKECVHELPKPISPQKHPRCALAGSIRSGCAIAVSGHVPTNWSGQLASLCVAARQGGWMLDLIPDQSAAYVRALPCMPMPWQVAGYSADAR